MGIVDTSSLSEKANREIPGEICANKARGHNVGRKVKVLYGQGKGMKEKRREKKGDYALQTVRGAREMEIFRL